MLSISDDIRPIIQNGRIAAIEIVEQIPYNRLPDLSVESETGYGAVIRPILSTERDERRTDPIQAGVFKLFNVWEHFIRNNPTRNYTT